jgi:hypothetical protein
MTPTVDVVNDILSFLVMDVVFFNPSPSPSSNSPAIVQVLTFHNEVDSWVLLGVNHTDDSLATS